MLCRGYIVIEILLLNILVEYKRDVSTAIPKYILCLFSRTNETGNARITQNLGALV